MEKVGEILQSSHVRDISHKEQQSRSLCHQVRAAYGAWRIINSPLLLDHWALADRESPKTQFWHLEMGLA